MSKNQPDGLAALNKRDFADRFGDAKARLSAAEDELEACKAEFERRGYDFAAGVRWKIHRDVQPQRRTDFKALRAKLGDAAMAEFEIAGSRTVFTARPVEGAGA